MSGKSSSETSQQSTTAPWTAAQPALQGILGQLQGNLGNTGISNAENSALQTMENNAGSTYQFNPAINGITSNLLNGGGATAQAGNINNAYQNYYNQTNPLASNTNYNPMSTPGFSDALNTKIADITNATNGSFAAAGRDFSGANSQALGRGITQGIAPTIASQYNQNIQNQQGAAGNLYNAGNTTAGLQAGLTQQGLANQLGGVNQVGTGLAAQNAGASSVLAAEAAKRGIPVQALGLLSQIGIPIAGLGSQSSGQSQTTNQMSGAQQFATLAGGFGKLFSPLKLFGSG